MSKIKTVNIGTSGWYYKHWRDNFYPHNLTEKEYLKYYSEHFSTVEVNSSFYHLLSQESVNNWIQTVPADFIFAVKASRYITHIKKLIEPEKTIPGFFESVKPFKDKIGPVLFQLPPNFGFNPERLESFLNVIPEDYRYVFEFRDRSRFNSETYEILRRNNVACCIYDLGDYQSPKEITTDFAYIRLHGPGSLGSGKYSEERLEEFCREINDYKEQGKDVFCYFNNDEAGYAVENAAELKQKLGL